MSRPQADQAGGHKRRRLNSIDRPWRFPGQQDPIPAKLTRLTAARLPSTTLLVGEMIEFYNGSEISLGLVRRLFLATAINSAQRTKYAHVHFARPSTVVSGYLLIDRKCANVPLGRVIHKVAGTARWVVGQGTWRDILAYTSVPRSESMNRDPFGGQCDSCQTLHAAHVRTTPVFTPDGFEYAGETYHVGDMAYLAPLGLRRGTVWDVGIITAHNPLEVRQAPRTMDNIVPGLVSVRICKPYASLPGAQGKFVAERHVYATAQLEARYIGDIMGKAIPNVKNHHRGLRVSMYLPDGAVAHVNNLRKMEPRPAASAQCQPESSDTLRLPSVDLYAGGGGSLLGTSKHFDVQHAIDTDPVCCATLQQNRERYFPSLKVHQMPVAQLERIQTLRRGRIALLVAGPPCQGHSLANLHRGADDDERNDEIAVTLAEIRRLQPDVAVLENVPGILVPNGGVDYAQRIVSRLLGIGYQIRIGRVNARDYGSPQNRERIFFIAARTGIPLPSLPRPSHAARKVKGPTTLRFDGGGKTANVCPNGMQGTAPFPEIDVRAAIGDLPPWGYEYDHPQYDPRLDVVGPRHAAYLPPWTDYQLRSRDAGDHVHDHVTRKRSERGVDAIMTAPRADEDGVPGNSRRAHPHSGIPTLLTTSGPGGMGTEVIHPSCQRTYTIAERKRAQGFPDGYCLAGTPQDGDRMAGNAINVHVAEALARQIKEDVFVPAWREWGKPDSKEFWRMWGEKYPVAPL